MPSFNLRPLGLAGSAVLPNRDGSYARVVKTTLYELEDLIDQARTRLAMGK